MNTVARLIALEGQRPPLEPVCVLVMVLDDGTSVIVCYPIGRANERMTLDAYHDCHGETYRHLERWTICDDAPVIADRMSEHW